MVKAKKKTTKRTGNKKPASKLDVWVKKYRDLDLIAKILILTVALFLFWFGIVRPLDKLRFELAARDLNNLATQIQKEIGPADKVESSKSCGYASAKFTKGNPSCSVSIVLHYADQDFGFANKALVDLSNLQKKQPIPGHLMKGFTSFTPLVGEDRQSFSHNIDESIVSIDCQVIYELNNERSTSKNFEVRLSCWGKSLFEHYSL